jgi:hypothetical protein
MRCVRWPLRVSWTVQRWSARRWLTKGSPGSGRLDADPLLLFDSERPLLKLEIVGVRELFRKGRTIDAYVKVQVGTTMEKTKVATRTSDPVFGDTFVFDFGSDEDKIVFEVWDQVRLPPSATAAPGSPGALCPCYPRTVVAAFACSEFFPGDVWQG